jgi:S-adenosylmethionine:tRNA ribosyltransferase-isomerase
VNTADFDFLLPKELIAQAPIEPRDAARLLVARGRGSAPHDAIVRDLPELLREGDLVVVNDTRVLPARVRGRRSTGGQVELLFLEPAGMAEAKAEVWRAMVKPAKKMRPGERVTCSGGVEAIMVEREAESGYWLARLVGGEGTPQPTNHFERLSLAGTMPLPPYIERAATEHDTERYQTVYARARGAVAAPTAGLHFTEELFERLSSAGIRRASVTLHVGAGTFLPVTAERLEEHRMHSERFELSEETAREIRDCRSRNGRIVAVGTTSARVLESCAVSHPAFDRDVVEPRSGDTDIFLHPGSGPRVCDGLFTNFHLPKSTLLMLVASFLGMEAMEELYQAAIERRYRFYSYGDASLLWVSPKK